MIALQYLTPAMLLLLHSRPTAGAAVKRSELGGIAALLHMIGADVGPPVHAGNQPEPTLTHDTGTTRVDYCSVPGVACVNKRDAEAEVSVSSSITVKSSALGTGILESEDADSEV